MNSIHTKGEDTAGVEVPDSVTTQDPLADGRLPAAGAGRGWLPELPRAAWVVLAVDSVSAVGVGLTAPFLLIYLHQARGIDLGVAGLVAALMAGLGIVGAPLGGTLTDRTNPRAVMIGGLLLAAAGTSGLILVRGPVGAFLTGGLLGFGVAVLLPAQATLIATLVPEKDRGAAFATGYATMNLGLGVGALLAAVLVDVDRPSSFNAIYLIDAATYLFFALLLLLALPSGRRTPQPADAEPPADDAASGYRTVLADRGFRRLFLLATAVITLTYGIDAVILPVYVTGTAGLSVAVLGCVLATNMVAVVVLAPLIGRRLGDRRPGPVVASSCLGFAVVWTLSLAGSVADGALAITAFVAAGLCFAVAESAFVAVFPALVNAFADRARPGLAGRYNGVGELAWTVGFCVGPIVGGFALGTGDGDYFVAALAPACLVLALVAYLSADHFDLPPLPEDAHA